MDDTKEIVCVPRDCIILWLKHSNILHRLGSRVDGLFETHFSLDLSDFLRICSNLGCGPSGILHCLFAIFVYKFHICLQIIVKWRFILFRLHLRSLLQRS